MGKLLRGVEETSMFLSQIRLNTEPALWLGFADAYLVEGTWPEIKC